MSWAFHRLPQAKLQPLIHPILELPRNGYRTAPATTMAKPDDMPPMTYRFLGRSGLQVSSISLGGWLTYGGHIDRGANPRLGASCRSN